MIELRIISEPDVAVRWSSIVSCWLSFNVKWYTGFEKDGEEKGTVHKTLQ